MQKKFITNLAFLLTLNLVIKPFWLLGIDRSVQNAVGAEAYGHYYALFNFTFLFNILLDIGITNFNNRNIAQNRHLLEKHLSGIILLRVCLSALYCFISVIAAWLLGYDLSQSSLIWLLLLNQVLISFILYFRSNISALHLFRVDSIVSVLDRAIMIGICGLFLWGNLSGFTFTIKWFVLAQTIAYVSTVLFCILFLSTHARMHKLYWNIPFFMMILRKSYPFAILILLMTFYNRIDSVMLERILPDGPRQAGVYAMAFRILDASNMVAYLFAGLLLPIFAHMLKNKEDVSHILRLAYSLLAVPAITLGLICWFYNSDIMHLLYVEHADESAPVFGILMSCFIAISTTYIYGTLLTANGNLRQLNIMASFGMLLNFLLNLILIPQMQAKGAAVASFITQSTTAIIQVVLCYRIFKLSPNFKIIMRFLAFVAIGLTITVAIKMTALSLFQAIGSIILLCMIAAFLLRLIDLKGIYKVLLKEST